MSDDDHKDDNVVSLDKHRRGRAFLSVFAEILSRWDTKTGGDLRNAIDDTLVAKGIFLDWEEGEWRAIDNVINAGIREGDAQLEQLRAELELSHTKRVLDAKISTGQIKAIVPLAIMMLNAGDILRHATVVDGVRGAHRICRICDGRFDTTMTSVPSADGVPHKPECQVLLYDQARAEIKERTAQFASSAGATDGEEG